VLASNFRRHPRVLLCFDASGKTCQVLPKPMANTEHDLRILEALEEEPDTTQAGLTAQLQRRNGQP